MSPNSSQASGGAPSPHERVKADSNFLRGRIAEELAEPSEHFSEDTAQVLKYHGAYQQDDRDRRRRLGDSSGSSVKVYQLMVRTSVPGGRLSGAQLLAHLDLCDELGNGTLRITSRQDLQLHAVAKQNVREVVRRINESGLTTMASCGDVRRNVTCCPAPYYGDPVHGQMQWMARRLTAELSPAMPSYRDIWLGDRAPPAAPCRESIEPLYGNTYLPRKLKVGIGLPGDNCVDLYAQDVGLMAICENFNVVGYDVLVGGGMGMTRGRSDTFPALARPMASVSVDETVDVVKAIFRVFRDFGNRSDRHRARLRYLLADWGIEKFKSQVETCLGRRLGEPRPDEVWDIDDHLGWYEQGDGRWFYGLPIESGRILDHSSLRLKSAIREICRRYQPGIGLTAGQNLLLGDIPWEDRFGIEDLLRRHGVKMESEISNVRRWSTACVALPTCSLAIAESERVLSGVVSQLEVEVASLGLARDLFSLRMSGCGNGCSRPYNADVGLVGRSQGRYAVYLGGRRLGNRLGFLYRDNIPLEQIVPTLKPILAYFKLFRDNGESLGDFCHRRGAEDLQQNVTVY